MTYLGIDIGGTKIQGAYLQHETIHLTRTIATPTSGYEDLLAVLVALTEAVKRETRTLNSIGVGVPGTVTERCVTWVPNLPFLDGKDLAGDLAQRSDTQVVVANDAQLALLGEMWRGAAQGRQSAILFSVGTGVGGAIMFGGRIVRGAHGSTGAFGWLNLDWREPPDPAHGYTERYAAGSALDVMAKQLDPSGTSHELVSRARRGDPAGLALLHQFSRILGAACASAVSILDPEVLIIAGGLSDAFDLISEDLHRALREMGSPGVRETPFVAAQSGKHAAAYGALRAAMMPQLTWL
ncbi:MAG TPA: ROK family protein [Ktedonobacteraceae bacterium]|nr:ROK family protein [Ktedonobacteraceae bacterium]